MNCNNKEKNEKNQDTEAEDKMVECDDGSWDMCSFLCDEELVQSEILKKLTSMRCTKLDQNKKSKVLQMRKLFCGAPDEILTNVDISTFLSLPDKLIADILNYSFVWFAGNIKVKDMYNYSGKPSAEELNDYISFFNTTCARLQAMILAEEDLGIRVKLIEKLGRVVDLVMPPSAKSKKSSVVTNFGLVRVLCSVFGSSTIMRLKLTWAKVSATTQNILDKANELMSMSANYKNLHTATARMIHSGLFFIPDLVLVMTSMVFVTQGNYESKEEGTINFRYHLLKYEALNVYLNFKSHLLSSYPTPSIIQSAIHQLGAGLALHQLHKFTEKGKKGKSMEESEMVKQFCEFWVLLPAPSDDLLYSSSLVIEPRASRA